MTALIIGKEKKSIPFNVLIYCLIQITQRFGNNCFYCKRSPPSVWRPYRVIKKPIQPGSFCWYLGRLKGPGEFVYLPWIIECVAWGGRVCPRSSSFHSLLWLGLWGWPRTQGVDETDRQTDTQTDRHTTSMFKGRKLYNRQFGTMG